MATRIVKKPVAEKVTKLKEIDDKINELVAIFEQLEPKDQIKALKAIGCASKYYTCQTCDDVRRKTEFYASTEPGNASGITKVCKECAEKIASPVINGEKTSPTKETVDQALYALNKPFLDSLWDSSLLEAANNATGKVKNNVWTSYIKNVAMPNYYNLTYKDSDNYTGGIYTLNDMEDNALPKDKEILEQFEKNKKDTLRLLGYLPFEKEKLSDQPFLYSQLIGFLDASEEGNDDMMRVSSIISIVRAFLQQSQIDDMIADLVRDPINASKNIATVKSLQDMKKNITVGITKLAESSCISLKHSRNSIKGENTWTGKTKKIKDMNLREFETNGFDMATCRGMRQVQEISDESIMKQLRLDESDWSDMLADIRQMNTTLRKERDSYREINRILLRENIDLKDFISENDLNISQDLVDLKDLYSVFGDNATEEESDEQSSTV